MTMAFLRLKFILKRAEAVETRQPMHILAFSNIKGLYCIYTHLLSCPEKVDSHAVKKVRRDLESDQALFIL